MAVLNWSVFNKGFDKVVFFRLYFFPAVLTAALNVSSFKLKLWPVREDQLCDISYNSKPFHCKVLCFIMIIIIQGRNFIHVLTYY